METGDQDTIETCLKKANDDSVLIEELPDSLLSSIRELQVTPATVTLTPVVNYKTDTKTLERNDDLQPLLRCQDMDSIQLSDSQCTEDVTYNPCLSPPWPPTFCTPSKDEKLRAAPPPSPCTPPEKQQQHLGEDLLYLTRDTEFQRDSCPLLYRDDSGSHLNLTELHPTADNSVDLSLFCNAHPPQCLYPAVNVNVDKKRKSWTALNEKENLRASSSIKKHLQCMNRKSSKRKLLESTKNQELHTPFQELRKIRHQLNNDIHPAITDPTRESKKSLKVLQNQGQLKVSVYMNFGLLTVHVVQGRHLNSKWKPLCDSFVKMSLVPDDTKRTKCKTSVIADSNSATYDEKFSFEVCEEDQKKRLLVSVWHKDSASSLNEFLGCMSFGVKHLTNPKKEVNGWYYLLTEEIGRHKHLKVSHKQKPQLKLRAHTNIPTINKDVWKMEPMMVTVRRGKIGYGFSVVESSPVRIGRINRSSPAEEAGLRVNDCIIRINGQNVSRSAAGSIAKLVKNSGSKLILDIQRSKENSDSTQWKKNGGSVEDYENSSEDEYFEDEPCKIQQLSVDDDFIMMLPEDIPTSTPLPFFNNARKSLPMSESRKQEALHRLMDLEQHFVGFMHLGIQRYSRPLRHCILSQMQHSTLFQNIEKLVTISEYQSKQMQCDELSSSDDMDMSRSSEEKSVNVGQIYHSKVRMLCEAYDTYGKGLSDANQVLSDLRCNDDFVRFIKDPPLNEQQPSISAFVYRPVQHIKELYQVLRDIFTHTSTTSQDYKVLKKTVESLQESINNITNYSCARASSIGSKRGSACSMKSQESVSSKGRMPSTFSMQTIRSVDSEVLKIQDKLVFSSNIPVFQLCHEERHLIYSGEIFLWEAKVWQKLHMLLFSDLILLTEKEKDGYMKVVAEPIMLKDALGIEFNPKHITDFILHSCPKELANGKLQTGLSTQKMVFRAPNVEQKYTWKSLVEQRVYSVKGSVNYYSNCSELSGTSAVIV